MYSTLYDQGYDGVLHFSVCIRARLLDYMGSVSAIGAIVSGQRPWFVKRYPL